MIDAMRYPGGKGKCYQQIINLMPAHTTYIESHLGGGAVMRHKKRAALNIGLDLDEDVIQRWHAEWPQLCRLVQADATTYLQNYPFRGGELVYCDPPYVKSGRRQARVYRHDFEDVDHQRLLGVLKTLPCMVMISGYESAIYAQELASWRTVTFSARTQADVRQECLWLNYPPPTHLHDGAHLGISFRERQSIKRRNGRWLERLDSMAPLERSHLVALIRDRYAQEWSQP
ncbi:DNA adenine methylase [Variovorax sp. RT4R15]|uniref:DNA adenine methylase n=1 Tax=Variovorax sp. RT4R15 TaxID=3443737 RepID=UPI003F4576B1